MFKNDMLMNVINCIIVKFLANTPVINTNSFGGNGDEELLAGKIRIILGLSLLPSLASRSSSPGSEDRQKEGPMGLCMVSAWNPSVKL